MDSSVDHRASLPDQFARAFTNVRVLVVGDLILDEYLIGRAERMSREAPIPVLEFRERRLIPGGAANPAANLAALGALAAALGIIGADGEGEALRAALLEHGIDPSPLVIDPTRPTTVKTRLMATMGLRFPQQVARLDKLSRAPVREDVEAEMLLRLRQGAAGANAILFSDYRVGAITPALVSAARELAQEHPLLLTADAQGALDRYVGFGLVKCNAEEARDFLGRDLQTDEAFAGAARDLFARLRLTRAMAITRGADGMTWADAEGAHHTPAAHITEVYDTVGAGDTAIAVLTLMLAAGAGMGEAAAWANAASGRVVQHVGNYTPKVDELLHAL